MLPRRLLTVLSSGGKQKIGRQPRPTSGATER